MVEIGTEWTYENTSLIRQSSKRLVQSLVHLRTISFEEATASYVCQLVSLTMALMSTQTTLQGPRPKHTSMEKRIPSKHDLVIPILHKPAYAILGVARRMQSLDGDAADVETFAVGRGLVHLLTVSAADNFEIGEAEGGAL